LPDRAVIVTIDDGFKNSFTTAFPILAQYQIPATIFPLTDWVFERRMCWLHRFYYLIKRVPIELMAEALAAETRVALPHVSWQLHEKANMEQIKDALKYKVANKHEILDRLYTRLGVDTPVDIANELYLSADDIHVMSEHGVEVGSHGCSQSPMSALSADEARWEVTKSKRILEDCIGRPVQAFAYPFGLARDLGNIRHLLEESGYQCALTNRPGLANEASDLYLLRRCDMAGQVGLWEEVLRVELSPWLRR